MAENYISKALAFAEKAHEGQKRRDGKAYFTHVEAVAKYVNEEWLNLIPIQAQGIWCQFKEHIVAAAVLHDTLEDTNTTKEQLLAEGFSVMTVETVDTVTKRNGENYFDFIMRIRDSGPYSVGAVVVKLADLAHNISDNAKEGSLLDKYRLAEYILNYFNKK
jgi:(p)ppGpp synthase/HD superfamily hydrolase